MYDNTREGERAQNNNLEYSDKKKNGNLVRMNIIETASEPLSYHYLIDIFLQTGIAVFFPGQNK